MEDRDPLIARARGAVADLLDGPGPWKS